MEKEILEIVAYFIIYSFLGWVLESIFKSILEKKFVNSGFLLGTFCPIYGFGAIIMYLFLEQVKGKPILTFCLGFVLLSIWEYIVGFLLEKLFKTKYWDYSNNKGNINGRVCFRNSIFWGLLSVVFIEFVHPFIQNIVSQVDYNIMLYTVLIILFFVLIDVIISVAKVLKLRQEIIKIEQIKERIEIIKQKGKEGIELSTENLQETIEKLKRQRRRIVLRVYRNTYRLKNAFPSMKSDLINTFLKEKDELIKTYKKKKTKE